MRILVADERPSIRFALRVLLDRQPEVQVAGEAADFDALLTLAGTVHPDLVLADCDLPGLGRLASLSALQKICPELVIIAISVRPETRCAALVAGAQGFVCKIDPPEELLAAIIDHSRERKETES